jgi:hypothetical protein
MANIHGCPVIATVRVAMGQKVTATMEPHMAQRYRCELPNFEMRHAHHLALPLAFLQECCPAAAARGASIITD